MQLTNFGTCVPLLCSPSGHLLFYEPDIRAAQLSLGYSSAAFTALAAPFIFTDDVSLLKKISFLGKKIVFVLFLQRNVGHICIRGMVRP